MTSLFERTVTDSKELCNVILDSVITHTHISVINDKMFLAICEIQMIFFKINRVMESYKLVTFMFHNFVIIKFLKKKNI